MGTEEFTAFYCRSSGYPVDVRLGTPEEIARVIHTKWELGLQGGLVIANPIPEADALEEETMERIIEFSARLEEFDVRSVSEGKDALGEVRVTITVNGRHYQGKGVSTDIIEAAAQAYLKALNKADHDRHTATEAAARLTPQL